MAAANFSRDVSENLQTNVGDLIDSETVFEDPTLESKIMPFNYSMRDFIKQNHFYFVKMRGDIEHDPIDFKIMVSTEDMKAPLFIDLNHEFEKFMEEKRCISSSACSSCGLVPAVINELCYQCQEMQDNEDEMFLYR